MKLYIKNDDIVRLNNKSYLVKITSKKEFYPKGGEYEKEIVILKSISDREEINFEIYSNAIHSSDNP